MRRTLFFFIAILGIGSALAACRKHPKQKPVVRDGSMGSSSSLSDSKDANVQLAGVGGQIIPNGLKPEEYHPYKRFLEKAALSALTSSPMTLNSTTFSAIPVDILIDDAISCTVPKNSVTRTTPDTYFPASTTSVLKYTGGWISASINAGTLYPNPPDQNPKEDLHTCLATRLNPKGDPVFIWVGGKHVNSGTADTSDYVIEEAYWSADHNQSDSVVDINVWPSTTVTANCHLSADSDLDNDGAVNTRVCGTVKSNCGLKVHLNIMNCADNGTGTGWQCPKISGCNCNTGIPCTTCQEVIKTKLKCSDWCTFYPSCDVPSECRTVLDRNHC
jgi:hypothetical protein